MHAHLRRARRPAVALVLAAIAASGALRLFAQPAADDGLDTFVERLRQAIAEGDPAAAAAFFAPTVSTLDRAANVGDMIPADSMRRVLRELERSASTSTEQGGRRVIVELFQEWSGRARLLTMMLTVERAAPARHGWWIVRAQQLESMDGLYRLRVDVATPYSAENLTIAAPDLQLKLPRGTVFTITSDEGVAGLVLLGRGEMRFTPGPESERGQLRLFAGREDLVTPFDRALVRLNPGDFEARIAPGALRPAAPDRNLGRRAEDIAAEELPKALTVDLRDVSPEPWHLLPRVDDFIAEVHTPKYDTLTYTRFASLPEDVSLISRERKLTIALYPSPAKLATQSRFYDDEAQREYDILDYDIDASISPARRFMRARARLVLRTRTATSTLTLRLAESLAVTSVVSAERGPLSHLRLRNQNAVMVRLPGVVPTGGTVTLTLAYAGLVRNQDLESEAWQAGSGILLPEPEPHLLLSSASNWYPQNPYADYATATLRITVPREFSCVGSGELAAPAQESSAAESRTSDNERQFVYRARQPLRYFSILVSRFVTVHEQTLTLDGVDAARRTLAVTVLANPLQRARAKETVRPLEDILRFYAGLLGGTPFPSTTLAVVEADLPGGHSPGYFMMLNSPMMTPVTWRRDPAAFERFPEFFLAHELAHQWWGQTVGAANYHERWISEGFAQYFAALYAQHARGESLFQDMLQQFRRWSLSESDHGPVYLGQRLGQINGGQQVYRALVYNKGAAVLHMLRRLLGDAVFFPALRRFFDAHQFAAAGTDDVQRAFEAESGRSLDRFFEGWVYGAEIPRVTTSAAITGNQVTVRLEQKGSRVFELPVTATLVFEDGSTDETVLRLVDRRLEQTIAADRRIRSVQFNRDSAALAEFDR